MSTYAQNFSTRVTPQTDQAHPLQQQNNAGGFSFTITDFQRLQRFLVLGSEGGTYYVRERPLTVDNAQCVKRCLDANPELAVGTIVEVSEAGRAPKNSPAIFALALAAGHESQEVRKLALGALPRVCRIGTHLFEFLACVQNFRGWGRALRNAVGAWYTSKAADDLAYQLVKYQRRHGWSNRDALRKSHAATNVPLAAEAALRWAVAGADGLGKREVKRGESLELQPALKRYLPEIIKGFEKAKTASPKELVGLIDKYGLTREMLPTEALNHVDVWEALLEHMPMTAMLRNLAKMTSVGLLKPLSAGAATVAARLGDQERLRRARIHPYSVLLAMAIYGQGHGLKGSLKWEPVREVLDALDGAFYASFGLIEPCGKSFMLALDASASMMWPQNYIKDAQGKPTPVSARVGSAAMAMATAAAEPRYLVTAFASGSRLAQLPMSPRQRLMDAVNMIERVPAGGTNCALPMMGALQHGFEVDVFVIYTDNETWAGTPHPHQALDMYRQKTGRAAKLVVVGMTSTEFSIANPNDQMMLDVVGFDTACPQLISDFARLDKES